MAAGIAAAAALEAQDTRQASAVILDASPFLNGRDKEEPEEPVGGGLDRAE
jgi:hypothetical protein